MIGALVHKPLAPRPDKIDLDEGPDLEQGPTRQDHPGLKAPKLEVKDTDRVADLITRRKQDGAG